ncbi:hypothetical protein [Janibacter sp. Soil728]|uniref:hypothetical protein n=1 Tax=Janibacter sp. Soil728 TaxID=1736393 RepID=UPI0006FB3A2B|nr:hypothetical protein [Janibacter sp. Soil728]
MTDDKRDARKAIDDLELDKHLAAAGAAAAKFAQQAVGAAGAFAAEHRDQAHGLLDKAEGEVDRITGGKATGFLGKVRSGLATGVDVVADQAPDDGVADEDPPASPPSSGV